MASSVQSKTLIVPSLKTLCLSSYLSFLESACAALIQLSMNPNPMFKRLTTSMLPTLKNHLETNLSGACFSTLREQMLEMLFSGKFPSAGHRNTYTEDLQNVPDDPGSHEDRARYQQIKEHGRGCCSTCCSGAFIVETMACVIVNDQVTELKFDFSADSRVWDKWRPIRKYVAFDVPSILSHLYASLKKNIEERKPQLQRLVINGTGLQTRQFTSSYDNTNFILNSYAETKKYVTYPTILSSSAVPGHSYPTNPYSEDLFLTLCDIFSFGLNSFDKLTEIQLGIELSTRSLAVEDRFGQPVSVKLFSNIGFSCPNLKVLDVSSAVSLPTECFIHLFFHDAFLTLHKYIYTPPWEIDNTHTVVQKQVYDVDEVLQHKADTYCPYCFDPWACNGVRAGCEFLPLPIPVLDDRLYTTLMDTLKEEAPKHLVNVIRASDLVKAAQEPMVELVRPLGPTPFEEGFDGSKFKRVPDGGWDYSWYDLGEDEPVQYQPSEASDSHKMNPICKSLQILRLGHLGPRYEIVPFLLTALPNIKTLGAVNVLNGLKMVRDIPEIGGVDSIPGAPVWNTGLEEITLDVVNRESGHNKLTAAQWTLNDDVKKDIHRFFGGLDKPITSVEEKRKSLAEDIHLVTTHCPNLRSISLFLFLEDFPGLLSPSETWVWQSLDNLADLQKLIVICHEWDEISALFSVVGSKLGQLCLSLDGRGRSLGELGGNQARVPALDTLMATCPSLHSLKIDLRMSTLALSTNPTEINMSRLRKLSVGLYLTREAFEWLWSHAANLEELLIPTISNTDTIDLFSGTNYQVYYTKEMLTALFKKNTLKQLRKFNVHMCIADIDSAFFLVERLRTNSPGLQEIGKLTIRVQLPQVNYPSQEELLNDVASLMQQMRRFKMDCESKSDPKVEGNQLTKIRWSWEKVGLFQSFAEIEQLNAMVEPQNLI